MAQVSGTTDTLDIVGMAEDIEDVIFDISPTETPFLTMAKRKKVTNTFHQWQIDSLTAAGANRQIEGDDASYTTATPTTMLANWCQISRKTLVVSRTADKVRKYGRAKETSRLLTKYGKELKRDMEYALVRNQASSTVTTSSTARSSAGLESMIAGNRIIASGNTTGTTPGYASSNWTAPTDGTTSALDETLFVSGIDAAWQDGGDPSVIMMNSTQKRKLAAFGGASKFAGTYVPNAGKTQSMVVGGVDLYISDFGEHKVKLNRHMRASTIFGLDPDYISVGMLDGIQYEALAKTGDADKSMLIVEFCLIVDNPDAHFKIQDLS